MKNLRVPQDSHNLGVGGGGGGGLLLLHADEVNSCICSVGHLHC